MIFMHFVGDCPYKAYIAKSTFGDNVTLVMSPLVRSTEMLPDTIHFHGSKAGLERALLAALEVVQAGKEDEDGSESGE